MLSQIHKCVKIRCDFIITIYAISHNWNYSLNNKDRKSSNLETIAECLDELWICVDESLGRKVDEIQNETEEARRHVGNAHHLLVHDREQHRQRLHCYLKNGRRIIALFSTISPNNIHIMCCWGATQCGKFNTKNALYFSSFNTYMCSWVVLHFRIF